MPLPSRWASTTARPPPSPTLRWSLTDRGICPGRWPLERRRCVCPGAHQDTFSAGVALHYLGLTACARGDHARAARCLAEMHTVDLVEGSREGNTFSSFAVLAVGIGQVEVATCLFGAGEALREAIGAALALPERATYEHVMQRPARSLVMMRSLMHGRLGVHFRWTRRPHSLATWRMQQSVSTRPRSSPILARTTV